MQELIEKIKKHSDFHKAGMILCHNGIVRQTSRDGKTITSLIVFVDHEKLNQIIENNKKQKGIIDIQVKIFENQKLNVGDDLMYLAVAGDFRENVIKALTDTLNEIKKIATKKTEFYN